MLSDNDVEAELSYSYLHAVAARAGFACEYTTRHLDSAGIDAFVREDGRRLAEDSALRSFSLHVSLKSTFQILPEIDEYFSFALPVHQYNRLREPRVQAQKILVLLRLSENAHQWLTHSDEEMVARRCAHWVSLRDAPISENEVKQTVRIPRAQVLSPASLMEIMTRLSRGEVIRHAT